MEFFNYSTIHGIIMFRTDKIFDVGELRISRGTDDMAECQNRSLTTTRKYATIAGPVNGLYRGVKWLGFQWHPMLGKSTLKQDMYEMIMETEGQLRDTPASAESALYLYDAVVWGEMINYTFLDR